MQANEPLTAPSAAALQGLTELLLNQQVAVMRLESVVPRLPLLRHRVRLTEILGATEAILGAEEAIPGADQIKLGPALTGIGAGGTDRLNRPRFEPSQPTFPGCPHCRRRRRAAQRWSRQTDLMVARRADKWLKLFDCGVQLEFRHVPDEVFEGPSGVDTVFASLDWTALAVLTDSDDKRQAVRSALFDGASGKHESLIAFAVRREEQFSALVQC